MALAVQNATVKFIRRKQEEAAKRAGRPLRSERVNERPMNGAAERQAAPPPEPLPVPDEPQPSYATSIYG